MKKVHEKYLKNARKTLDLKIWVFSGGFQSPPFVRPPFAILGEVNLGCAPKGSHGDTAFEEGF